MKKVLFLLLLILAIAYFTKPDDKTCIMEGVKAVWGDRVPDMETRATHFDAFINVNLQNVAIQDRVFFKQIQYKVKDDHKTVAIGAFKNVFAVVKPIERNDHIPPMPPSRR